MIPNAGVALASTTGATSTIVEIIVVTLRVLQRHLPQLVVHQVMVISIVSTIPNIRATTAALHLVWMRKALVTPVMLLRPTSASHIIAAILAVPSLVVQLGH